MSSKKPALASSLKELSSSLQERVVDLDEITHTIYTGLKNIFPYADVSIYILNPAQAGVDLFYPQQFWPLPEKELAWLSQKAKENLNQHTPPVVVSHFYVENRAKSIHTDLKQLRLDIQHFNFVCNDGLFYTLTSEDEVTLGIVFIHSWASQKLLSQTKTFKKNIESGKLFLKEMIIALDNYFIHEKIESLLSDKRQLKQRIQKDEEDLKRRVLELTVLYETSNALSYSLNYYQMVDLMLESLYKVLHFDLCSIFLLDFVPMGEIITRVNTPLDPQYVATIQYNVISASIPFVQHPIDIQKVRLSTENVYKHTLDNHSENMKSFANIPLIFKEDVIGMLNICSTQEGIFGRNEMTFLHTMTNQLAAHLGRLKMVKRFEKFKIGTVIKSMAEGIVMLDENQQTEIINPATMNLLGLESNKKLDNDAFINKLKEMGVYDLFKTAQNQHKPVLNYELTHNDKNLLMNITHISDLEEHRSGLLFVFRDFTELQRINKVRNQQLEVIARVNLIIKSITDLDNLLIVILEFVLNLSNAEMGSIQLKQGKTFQTKVHSNFPDKIRKMYRFKNNETISDYAIRTGEVCFIEDYWKNPKVSGGAKIFLESYLCIPIMVKNELIGLFQLARKLGNESPKLTSDDVQTLTTVTSLIATAIHNALLYQETLEKQKIDQELKVANEIQTKLLPEKLPDFGHIGFGAISVPAREIGGDYYDFFELDNGDIGIVMADIVGKGIPAGLYMAMLKSILHTHFLSYTSPKAALEKINALLYRDPVISKFVPLFYAIFNPNTLELRYCNAGHEPALVFTKNGFITLDTMGYPLGSMAESSYEEKQITLSDQDMVLLYTDGIIEARNEKGGAFGYTQLKNLVKKSKQSSAKQVVESIYSHIKKNFQPKKQHDDLTLVVLKVDLDKTKKSAQEAPLKTQKIKVSSSLENIKKIRFEVDSFLNDSTISEDDRFNIKLAINEAQANVIEHAYFGNENGDIIFEFRLFKETFEVFIKDFGKGWGQRTTKGKDHLDELEGSGLGVFLIDSIMDKVSYNGTQQGTELHMIKFLKKESDHGNT